MIWRRRLIILLMALLAGVQPAAAEPLIPHSQLIDELADCLVRHEPKLTGELLRSSTAAHPSIMETLAKRASACMKNSRLQIPQGVFLGSVAGATLRAMPNLSAAARTLPVVPARRIDGNQDNARVMIALATCVAGMEPAGTAYFIARPQPSLDATVTAELIGPALQACVPEALAFRLGLPDLRVALSAALYQRLFPPAGAAGG